MDTEPTPDDDGPSDAVRQYSNGGTSTPTETERAVESGDDAVPVVAEFAVEHRDAILGDTIRAVPSVTIEPNYRTTDDRSSLLVFTAVGGSLDEFDVALEADHTVRDPVSLAATDDARAYRVRYSPDTLRFSPTLADLGALSLDVRSEDRTWWFRVQFPSRTAFATFRNYCSTNDVALQLFKLYQDESTGGGLGLTARQWETLTVAHEMGYFDVPRNVTQEELARRLGVSPSAVSQRIRRATSQLLAESLESSQFGPGN